jgi:PIN domain nuclease of toxin-antitoxin system
MRILLDSHALLWFVEDDPQMPESIKQIIENDENEKYLSIATIWELSIKYGLGKLQLSQPVKTYIPLAMKRNGLILLRISARHALRVSELPHHHKDPFDRLLVAQSLLESMPLVSADAILDAYGISRLW